MNSSLQPGPPESIAVVGMAGRFPDAADTRQLWKNLCAGLESVRTFTDEQLISSGVEANLLEAPNYVKAGVVLEGIELFDAEFFGITAREAKLTDPQHRIFLECAWEALEDAGYRPDGSQLRVGVFAGSGPNNYFAHNLMLYRGLMNSLNDLQLIIMVDKDYLATRVSYKLNLKGPAISIQSACSTSLVAVHLACQSLLLGECDMALAGGVSLTVPQIRGYSHLQGSILSPDGHCRAFDAAAQGTVIGSGAGIVVLRRLTDAVRDGDCIHAVIRSSAINNDGSEKIGYTAPSVEGQATVIAEAQALAGVTGDEITYVEAHGTGTKLGDPIEVAALSKAFRRTTQRKQFCALGSLKTNFGHLDAAAGVAALIKVVLALENRQLPPSLNFRQSNPEIDFSNTPFYVQQTLSEWYPNNGRRVAGVSCFGIGGTNVHAIVEQAPPLSPTDSARPWQLLTISARSHRALEKATERLAEFLANHPGLDLADVSFTLQRGRKTFANRRILAAKNMEEAIALLRSQDRERIFTGSQEHSNPPVAFMFPGQAAQYVNMGLGLYVTEKTFREDVDSCSEFLKSHLACDLRHVLYPSTDRAAEARELLNQTAVTQPAIFVVEYALAKLWMDWGFRPEAMIGHSIGEYVAACLAGVFPLKDALALVAARGRLMQSMPEGSMLAIRLDEKSAEQYLDDTLSLAAINGPFACVAAGPHDAIASLRRLLTKKQIGCRLLPTSHAFHSQMMQPIVGPFRELFADIKLNPPKIPYLSNLTGTWIDPLQATDPAYWGSHLRERVRFSHGLRELLLSRQRILLEVGPGDTLTSLAKQHLGNGSEQAILSSWGHAKDGTSELPEMMTTLGRLWVGGAQPDWQAFYRGQRRRRVSLPTYPFERQRYWIEEKKSGASTSLLPEVSLDASPEVEVNDSDRLDRMHQPGSPLLSHHRPQLTNAYVPPKSDLHEVLGVIWGQLLGFEKLGIEDDFFDLGGDSLLATQVISRLRTVFRMELPPNALFDAPTIDKLARYLIEHGTKSGLVERTANLLRQIERIPQETVVEKLRSKEREASTHQ
jgi:phthiocerol/phenolphthiocerol synthesis type-I polyketide synthase E